MENVSFLVTIEAFNLTIPIAVKRDADVWICFKMYGFDFLVICTTVKSYVVELTTGFAIAEHRDNYTAIEDAHEGLLRMGEDWFKNLFESVANGLNMAGVYPLNDPSVWNEK
jgi:hypothetical protein